MSEKLQWFQFYATDWISDESVRLLTSRQRGWYIDLLAHDWQEGGIPDDIERCQNLTSFWADYIRDEGLCGGGPDNWVETLRGEFGEIFEFFSKNGHGRRTHKRLQSQRRSILAKSLRQSEGARLTNAKRNAKRSANRNGKHAPSDAVSGSVSETEPEPELEEDSSSSSEISTTGDNNTTQAAAAPSALLPAIPPHVCGDLAKILETFRAFGRGCTDRDLKICQRLWDKLTTADRQAALVDIQTAIPLWRGRPTEKIPQPWNYLDGRYWERSVNRKQPEQEMGKFERGFRKAAAEFIRETSAGGNKP